MLPTYQPSGKYSSVVFLFVPAAAAIAAGTAWLYVLLLDWIPYIILSFGLSFGFAFVMGLIARSAIRTAKCRNASIGGLLGLMVGFAGLCAAHYWSYSTAVATAPGPVTFFDYVQWRAANGFSISSGHGSSSTSSGVPISGVFFYLVWVGEAAIILLLAWLGGKLAASAPFCEECKAWADRKAVEFGIPGLSEKSLDTLARATDIDTILTPPLTEVAASPSEVLYTVKSCPGCSNTAFATLTHRLTVPPAKGKGKPEVKLTAMLADVKLDQLQAEAILALRDDVQQALQSRSHAAST